MPYIDQVSRKQLDGIDSSRAPFTVGELTYCIYRRCIDLAPATNEYDSSLLIAGVLTDIDDYLAQKERISYAVLCEVVGALRCANYEWKRQKGSRTNIPLLLCDTERQFYGQTVAPYEDQKIEENGDIE